MKKFLLGILVVFVVSFTGCNDDEEGYSLNDMWIGFGVLKKSVDASPKAMPTIIMDNDDMLVPVASNYTPAWPARFDDGDRVLVNYTILDDDLSGDVPTFFVKVNSIEDILMKDVMDITPEIEDSIGNDPIIVQDFWITDSLLNFKLKYWGFTQIHFLNLVKEPGELTEESQPVQLELRHNANDDDESVPYTAFVSFSLNPLRIEGLDSVRFEFSSTDYDGVKHSVEKVFNYSDLD
ncbi:MAG: NigD-like protein, partial [Bacteroidota bacterium]